MGYKKKVSWATSRDCLCQQGWISKAHNIKLQKATHLWSDTNYVNVKSTHTKYNLEVHIKIIKIFKCA